MGLFVMIDNWTLRQRQKLNEYRAELATVPHWTWRAEYLRRMVLWTEEAIAVHLEWKAASASNVIELAHYRR
ncbi:hypothetical protein HGP16_29255 [Rhizobium sp. P40RR-XXII]|uniref:hypothetical protein n=1 Tax=unclassified Rhizobium TaxID=2613769 RepID=UPI001456BF4E|nr:MULTISPECIES: hypothetical protein [unclassified Rhizobium]NLR88913.1 hypothetical protein [Rhizobium sp. P28RR-XV]NLS20609.1 hypothetical protein [Rhizobium sp. P40RR-XXII]